MEKKVKCILLIKSRFLESLKEEILQDHIQNLENIKLSPLEDTFNQVTENDEFFNKDMVLQNPGENEFLKLSDKVESDFSHE
jgi:hypothetical protein